MKFAVVLLCLLPLAFAAPQAEKRALSLANILPSFGLDLTQIKGVVSGIATAMEGDDTEQSCEEHCGPVLHQVMASHQTAGDLLTTFCPFLCNSFQALAHQLNVHIS